MQINFENMTLHELALVIKAASAELERRLNETPTVHRVPTVRPVITVNVPPEDDKDFILSIKQLLKSGGYAKAAERRRTAEIAERYPEWTRRQGVPMKSNAGDWERARNYQSRPRAKEHI